MRRVAIALFVLAVVAAAATYVGADQSRDNVLIGVWHPDGGKVAVPGTSSGAALIGTTPFVIDTTRLGDCATTSGDGGQVVLAANARYRCIARNADMCLNNGAVLTTCSLTAPIAPNGMFVSQGQAEEVSFPVAYPGVDAGARNNSAVLYLMTPAGSGCLSCNLLTPQ